MFLTSLFVGLLSLTAQTGLAEENVVIVANHYGDTTEQLVDELRLTLALANSQAPILAKSRKLSTYDQAVTGHASFFPAVLSNSGFT